MTITLPPDLEDRLRGAASRRGIDAAAFVRQLIEDRFRAGPGHRPPPDAATAAAVVANRSTIALLDEWEREDATSDPQEVARREAEFEAFRRGMNQNRLDSDGPAARVPYP